MFTHVVISPYKRYSVTRYGRHISVYIIPFCMGLVHVARTGSVYVTMSITLERYFAIVHPLKDFMILKKFLLPFTVVFSVIYNLPKVIVLIFILFIILKYINNM